MVSTDGGGKQAFRVLTHRAIFQYFVSTEVNSHFFISPLVAFGVKYGIIRGLGHKSQFGDRRRMCN